MHEGRKATDTSALPVAYLTGPCVSDEYQELVLGWGIA